MGCCFPRKKSYCNGGDFLVKYSFMNIALFTDSFLPTKSGIVTVVLQLQRILVAMGHNVVIVTTDTHDKYIEEKFSDKSNILRMKSFSSAFFGVPDQFISIVDKKRLIAFLKEHNVEFIHSHTEFSIGQAAKFASKELGIPAIATTHTLWEDFYKYYLWGGKFIPVKLIRRIVRWMYRDFYALVNVSQKAHEYFKLPFMLPQSPSAIIPNALDSDTFLRHTISEEKIQAAREKWGIKKGDVVFLFLGRVVYEKRVEELLDICLRVIQKNEHIKILFVGDGLALQGLKKKSAKFSDRIIFTGYVPWRDVHSFYQLGDVYVTASLSEMHSMTVLEALMSGLPVVVRYDTSFSDTVFHGENGYFANSDEEMDGYLLELAADEEKRKVFGKRSLEISKTFSLEMFGRRTMAFYEKVFNTFPNEISDAELQKAVDAVEVEK